MKKQEMTKLLKFLNSYYQQKFDYPKENKQDTKMMIETWYMFLGEFNYELVRASAKKMVVNKEWPPTPGELVQEVQKMQMDEQDKLTAGEAWKEVLDAISRYGSTYGAKKTMDSLPDRVAKAVECCGGIRAIGMSSADDSYMMNQFKTVYNQLTVREHEKEMLPGNVREDVEKITEKFKDNPGLKGETQGQNLIEGGE
mgnify:CR=1 FL=1